MTAFKDSAGDSWSLKLTVAGVDRVLEITGLDLYSEEAVQRLLTDYRLVCAVGCAMLLPEISAKGLTSEQFRDRLDGDAAAALVDAFWEAIINFTRPELRATRKKIVEKIKEAEALQAVAERKRLESGLIDRAIQAEISHQSRVIENTLAKRCAEISGGSPENSVLTPATVACAN